MKKRGAVFYIIDAFIAAGIITMTLVIIGSSYASSSGSTVAYQALSGHITFLQTIPLRNAPGQVSDSLIRSHLVSDGGISILDALIELVATNNTGNATLLMTDINEYVLQSQFGMRIRVVNATHSIPVVEKNLARESVSRVVLVKRSIGSVYLPGRVNTVYVTESSIEEFPTIIGAFECDILRDIPCVYSTHDCDGSLVFRDADCGLNVPSGCTRNMTVCSEFLPPQVLGPYTTEVKLWA